jgi:hypothetical protein
VGDGRGRAAGDELLGRTARGCRSPGPIFSTGNGCGKPTTAAARPTPSRHEMFTASKPTCSPRAARNGRQGAQASRRYLFRSPQRSDRPARPGRPFNPRSAQLFISAHGRMAFPQNFTKLGINCEGRPPPCRATTNRRWHDGVAPQGRCSGSRRRASASAPPFMSAAHQARARSQRPTVAAQAPPSAAALVLTKRCRTGPTALSRLVSPPQARSAMFAPCGIDAL